MYKSYFFLEGPWGQDPFNADGEDAAAAMRRQVPGATGATQSRSLAGYNGEQLEADAQAPFVGIVELWFEHAAAALDTVAYAKALGPLLAPKVQVGPIITGRARTVMRLPSHHTGQFIKGVFPFRRLQKLTVAEFQHYWWLQHGPIAALTEQAVYYLQCHPLSDTYAVGKPPYDGITELHWSSVAAARESMASRQMLEDQGNDAKNFVEVDSVALFLAREEVLIPA